MFNYYSESKKLIEQGDFDSYIKLVESAFTNTTDEYLLAYLVGQIYELDISNGFWLLEKFVYTYPDSVEIIRVYLSELWARNFDFDKATNEARIYLRQLQDKNLLNASLNKTLQESKPRSMLLLTSAYTELGARSYSIRVLKMAEQMQLSSEWSSFIEQSIESLQSELKNNNFSKIDHLWEKFFNTGEGYCDLTSLIHQNNYDILSKRLELIRQSFIYNENYKVDETEILGLVFVTEDNQFYLD